MAEREVGAPAALVPGAGDALWRPEGVVAGLPGPHRHDGRPMLHGGSRLLPDRPRLHRPPSVLPTFVLVAFVTCWRQPERYLVLLEANNGQDATGFVPLP